MTHAKKISRILATLLLAVLPVLAAGEWKDRSEYDLVLRIRAEASPQMRIALLDEWSNSKLRDLCPFFLCCLHQTILNFFANHMFPKC